MTVTLHRKVDPDLTHDPLTFQLTTGAPVVVVTSMGTGVAAGASKVSGLDPVIYGAGGMTDCLSGVREGPKNAPPTITTATTGTTTTGTTTTAAPAARFRRLIAVTVASAVEPVLPCRRNAHDEDPLTTAPSVSTSRNPNSIARTSRVRPTKLGGAVLIFLLALAVAGCGSGHSPATGSPAADHSPVDHQDLACPVRLPGRPHTAFLGRHDPGTVRPVRRDTVAIEAWVRHRLQAELPEPQHRGSADRHGARVQGRQRCQRAISPRRDRARSVMRGPRSSLSMASQGPSRRSAQSHTTTATTTPSSTQPTTSTSRSPTRAPNRRRRQSNSDPGPDSSTGSSSGADQSCWIEFTTRYLPVALSTSDGRVGRLASSLGSEGTDREGRKEPACRRSKRSGQRPSVRFRN